MKRRTVIKTGVILTSLCVSAWQLPGLLEKVLGTLRPQGSAGALGALGALTGGGKGAGGVGSESTLGDIAGLEGFDLAALGVAGVDEAPVKERKVLVISPDGPAVLETERAVLRPRTRVVEERAPEGEKETGEKPGR